jgi:hypothetical protein
MANPGPAIAGIPNTELALASSPISRWIGYSPLLTATVAGANSSYGLQYMACPTPISASRLDVLYNMSYGTAATSATGANVISAWAGIYSSFVSSNTAGSTSALSLLSFGTTQQTVSIASNASGLTGLSVAGIRPISVPINVNMAPGEYFIGFAQATATSSVGAATTTNALSMSAVVAGSNQSAVAYAELTAATNSTSNLWGFQGLYTSTITAVPQTIAQSNIAQTGTNQQYGQFAFVLRNY